MPAARSTLYKATLGVVAAAALVGVAYSIRGMTQSRGGTESDTVMLVCTKCQAESSVKGAEFEHLRRDPQTGGWPCPQCGAPAAQLSSLRCPGCKRLIPPQPYNAPLACPFCKQSLAEDAGGS